MNAKNEFNQLKINLENKVNDEIDKINYFLSQLPDDVSNLMIKIWLMIVNFKKYFKI